MADPVVKNIAQGEWVVVASATTCGMINKIAYGFDYYQTYRAAGEAAPDAIVDTLVPEEAVPMFPQSPQEIIAHSEGVDIYVCCWNRDNRIGIAGRIRVDL